MRAYWPELLVSHEVKFASASAATATKLNNKLEISFFMGASISRVTFSKDEAAQFLRDEETKML